MKITVVEAAPPKKTTTNYLIVIGSSIMHSTYTYRYIKPSGKKFRLFSFFVIQYKFTNLGIIYKIIYEMIHNKKCQKRIMR